jgi:hypothetical protein
MMKRQGVFPKKELVRRRGISKYFKRFKKGVFRGGGPTSQRLLRAQGRSSRPKVTLHSWPNWGHRIQRLTNIFLLISCFLGGRGDTKRGEGGCQSVRVEKRGCRWCEAGGEVGGHTEKGRESVSVLWVVWGGEVTGRGASDSAYPKYSNIQKDQKESE